MGNYRKATIYSQTDASTAKTEPIDLDFDDIVSRLQIRYEPTNGGETPTDHPAKCVSKVELVDGSDVLMSLSGQQIEAMDFYETHRPRSYELEYRGFYPMELTLNLNFGRWLMDPNLAFDPKRFTNPQLKITHNKALGGSTPNAAKLTVVGDIFDEKIVSPLGWLMSKEFYSYTAVASAYKTIDLPDDYILKRMLIQHQQYPYCFMDNITDIRIDENNLKKIPLDLNMWMYMASILNTHPMYDENVVHTTQTNCPVYITGCEYPSMSIGSTGSSRAYVTGEAAGGKMIVHGTATETSRSHISAWMPHGCLPVEFGDQWDMSDWYDITRIKATKLRLLHSGDITGSVAIVLQQLRRY